MAVTPPDCLEAGVTDANVESTVQTFIDDLRAQLAP